MTVDQRGQVFLFGANSIIGWSILQSSGLRNVTPFLSGLSRQPPPGIDRGIHLDDELAVSQLFMRHRPALIVHCAGVCCVETCEKSPDFAYSVNVEGARILADYAPPDARIVYLSSDHVFGAGSNQPFHESSAPCPISVYGRTRVMAEQILARRPNTLIVRSSLWIGPSGNGRTGHLDWLRYRHRKGLPMTVVADEIRSALWAEDAARRVAALARSTVTGIRHVPASQPVSRPDLARYLIERFGIGACFTTESRHERRVPHLGRVELASEHTDELGVPLPAVTGPVYTEGRCQRRAHGRSLLPASSR